MLPFAARGQRCSVTDTAQETLSGLTTTAVPPPLSASLNHTENVTSSGQRSSDLISHSRDQTVT